MPKPGTAQRVSKLACAPSIMLLFATFVGAMFPQSLRAQEVRGIVLTPDGGSPASGVVAVLMLDARRDSIVARAVTNERGRFTMRVPPNASTTLRLLRIGYDPMEAGRYTLVPGQIVDASFTLHDNRIRLATIDVKSAARCEVQPTGAQLVAQLFLQARTALIASTSSLTGVATARAVSYDRRQARNGKLLDPVERRVLVDPTVKPYASLGADSLDKVGYIVPDGTDAWYFAPDADVLLSDKFLAKHCLQMVTGKDSLAGSVGVAFRPVAERRGYTDVKGTLWLDKTTSELQFLEYEYTSLPPYLRGEKLGGRVDYAQLPNGGWFVSNWNIRMPIVTFVPGQVSSTRAGSTPGYNVVSGYQISGGIVQQIAVDNLVAYQNTEAATAGSMPGDASPSVVMTLNDTRYLVNGDSGTVRSFCGARVTYDHEGLVHGRVVDESGKPFNGASVKASWREGFRIGGGMIRWEDREVATTSSSVGSYFVCGIPMRRAVNMFATRTERFGKPATVRITEELPIAQIDLKLPPLKSRENDERKQD